jgi:D-alanyl-D-alanine carboxypeptidase/D-alanyl-D-alanine-endopeptidase (penicillin-binding protein 4)
MRGIFYFSWVLLVFLPASYGWSSPSDSLGREIESLARQYSAEDLDWGIFIQDLSSGQVIYQRNGGLFLNPASNAKILTSLAALSLLGPDFTFKTQLRGTEGAKKGTLKTLVLKGFGDPMFTTAHLEAMVRELKDRGIRVVEQIFVDGSYFDGEDFPGQMDGRQRDASFNCSVGAVSIDHNLLEIVVTPGEKAGLPVEAAALPPLPGFPLAVEAVTSRRKGRLVVKNGGKGEEDLAVSVTGTLAYKAGPQNYRVSIHQPLRLAALRLSAALQYQGIEAPRDVQLACGDPKTKILVESQSPPLKEILQEMNKQSDNFIAEQITKVLGAEFSAVPGNTEKGAAVILKRLKEMGIQTDGITLENGSGLSKKSRVTAQTLAQVLQKSYEDPKIRAPFMSSLSVMGVDGTLRRRFRHSELAGRFLGKSGTLRGVSSLSGYVFPKNSQSNHPYLFSFIVNGTGRNFWKTKEFSRIALEILINGANQ